MSKKEKNCLNCKIYWDREGGCEVCRWEDEDHPSLFYHITRSPEVLAEKLVYCENEEHTFSCALWRSTLLGNTSYARKDEALAATVAKLNEVME